MAELLTQPIIRFMPSMPRMEPVVKDTSGMSVAKSCKRKYFFSIVLGYKPIAEPPYFTFGRAYHKFRETLELEANFGGKDLNASVAMALDKALTVHHTDPRPGSSKWDFLTKACLVGSCKTALDYWLKEKAAKKIEVIATEQVFKLVLSDNKTSRGGRIDQLVKYNGQLWGRDFKTSSKNLLKKDSKERMFYENSFDPNDQFSCYTWAESQLTGERVSGQMVEVMVNGKTFGPGIANLTTMRTPNQLKIWEETQIAWEEELELCRVKDRWPQNETQCSFCPYHAVCKMTTEQAMISKLKSSMYKHAPYDFEAHYED